MDRRAFVLAAAGAAASCAKKTEEAKETTTKVNRRAFGTTKDGGAAELFTLRNAHGMEATITNYGGIVTSLLAPDKSGKPLDIVLGYDDLAGYLKETPYFGALIGRYGNRIGNARFTLEGKEYKLPANDGKNTLHGGVQGFDKRLWHATEDGSGLKLHYVSKDGEEGFPGNLNVQVTYSLTPNNELRIDYLATTDQPTVVNLTNHSYFNLAGQGEGDILGHEVTIAADRITPVDSGLIPTGSYMPVEGTPFDFRAFHAIGERIGAAHEQLKFGKGYDHNWVLNKGQGSEPALAARVREPKSGRTMEVLTTEPGLQFYTGNFLDGSIRGKGGKVYGQRAAFCMETQHFPDSPNKPEFPTTVLRPGQEYRTTTVYRFGLA